MCLRMDVRNQEVAAKSGLASVERPASLEVTRSLRSLGLPDPSWPPGGRRTVHRKVHLSITLPNPPLIDQDGSLRLPRCCGPCPRSLALAAEDVPSSVELRWRPGESIRLRSRLDHCNHR